MKIVIPSYRRPNVITINLLKQFSADDIYIFVHDNEDFQAYQHLKDRAHIIQTNAPRGIANQRNAILNYFQTGENIIMLDDDIKAIKKLTKDRKHIEAISHIRQFFEMGFDVCRAKGYKLWGIYPIDNSFYMSFKAQEKHFIIGTVSGIIINNLRYDANAETKEDYDYTIQNILRYRGVLRLDYYAAQAGHYSNRGGLFGVRNDGSGVEKKTTDYLLRKYPKFVKKNPRRENEILLNF